MPDCDLSIVQILKLLQNLLLLSFCPCSASDRTASHNILHQPRETHFTSSSLMIQNHQHVISYLITLSVMAKMPGPLAIDTVLRPGNGHSNSWERIGESTWDCKTPSAPCLKTHPIAAFSYPVRPIRSDQLRLDHRPSSRLPEQYRRSDWRLASLHWDGSSHMMLWLSGRLKENLCSGCELSWTVFHVFALSSNCGSWSHHLDLAMSVVFKGSW
jgi:hypothetical protein